MRSIWQVLFIATLAVPATLASSPSRACALSDLCDRIITDQPATFPQERMAADTTPQPQVMAVVDGKCPIRVRVRTTATNATVALVLSNKVIAKVDVQPGNRYYELLAPCSFAYAGQGTVCFFGFKKMSQDLWPRWFEVARSNLERGERTLNEGEDPQWFNDIKNPALSGNM
jgi:hypothetical protein